MHRRRPKTNVHVPGCSALVHPRNPCIAFREVALGFMPRKELLFWRIVWMRTKRLDHGFDVCFLLSSDKFP